MTLREGQPGLVTSLSAGSAPAGGEPRVGRPELADIGRLVRRAVRGIVQAARIDETITPAGLLRGHFPGGVGDLATVEEQWPDYDHVNVQAGLDAWLAAPGRRYELVGVVGYQHRGNFGLGDLVSGEPHETAGIRPGNVARANLPCGPNGAVRACVRCGMYLVRDGHRRIALLLRGAEPHSMHQNVTVEVAAGDPDLAASVAEQIRALSVEHNVFRGQVLSFGSDVFGRGAALLRFHARPALTASQLVLPDGVLDAVQRQVVGVAQHKERLLAAGQHLKRGVLLYGPPGVGKTHTVRYLVSSLVDTTIIELTGNALQLIGQACSIARTLAPAMLVVEDVDLIAEDRGLHPGHHPLLFQLLNEMDGLAEDADVVFVLTTNRADLLEPALAARPGRIDQAIELHLPDAPARRALFELYRGELTVDTSRLDDVIARTEGVTAAFLKELLRRAAVRAADDSTVGLAVSADALDAALDELLDTRSAMTRVLLGGVRDAAN